MTTTQHSGTDLRDLSSRFIRAAHIDFHPAYITDIDNKDNPINGLIRTHVGYFRLFQDDKSGKTLLLHSFSREALTGERNKKGNVRLSKSANNDYDIYVVSARGDISGKMFRRDMNEHIDKLERQFKGDVNLHVREITEDENGKTELKAVQFANKSTGFLLYEDAKDKWHLRTYFNIRAGWDKTGRFAEVDFRPPGFFRRFFSLSREEASFDTLDDGLQHLRRLWMLAAVKRFKGRTSPVDVMGLKGFHGFKVGLATKWADFIENRRYKEWGIALAVGVGTGVFGLGFLDFSSIGAFATAVGGIAAGSVASKALEKYYHNKSVEKLAAKDELKAEALKSIFDQEFTREFIAALPGNEERLNRKISPLIVPSLRALDHTASDMNYDNGEFSAPENPMKDIERLCTAPFHYYGALFDIPHYREENGKIIEGVLVGAYPNGLLSIVHIDLKTRATRYYFTHRAEFDIMGAGKKADADAALSTLPGGDAKVHKITHRGGKNFRYVAMNEQDFLADLMFKAGPQVKDYHAFGLTLSQLFNVQGADKIVPKATETEAVPGTRKQKVVALQPA